jgi:hypothetical protein
MLRYKSSTAAFGFKGVTFQIFTHNVDDNNVLTGSMQVCMLNFQLQIPFP